MTSWSQRARARMARRKRTQPLAGPDDCEVLYHVTYSGRLAAIAEEGLDPRAVGAWEGGGYGAHSRRGTFLTEPGAVRFWYHRLQEIAEQSHEPEDLPEWVPVVLRVECALFDDRMQDDEAGSRDAPDSSYITTQAMPPEELRMWNGEAWVGVEPFEAAEAAGMEEGEYGWEFPAYDNPLIPPASELR